MSRAKKLDVLDGSLPLKDVNLDDYKVRKGRIKVNFTISAEIADKLDEYVEETGMTKGAVIDRALKLYVKLQQEKEIASK